jgi:hypothetical protein
MESNKSSNGTRAAVIDKELSAVAENNRNINPTQASATVTEPQTARVVEPDADLEKSNQHHCHL